MARRAMLAHGAALVALLASVHAAEARTPSASSGSLTIVGPAGATWDDVLREIQASPDTVGRTYALGVRSSGATYHCGDYTLSLDVGPETLLVDGCDTRSDMTRVRVVSRDALFDTSDFVPRPKHVAAHALLLQHADADGGGGSPSGGSRVGCSVRLEPYLWDALHGKPVPLPYDRFELRPLSEEVHAAPDGAGWIARGESHMAVRFRYDVVDRATGRTVVNNEATLTCDDQPATPPRPAPASPAVITTTRVYDPPSTFTRTSAHSGLPRPVFFAAAGLTGAALISTLALAINSAAMSSACAGDPDAPAGACPNPASSLVPMMAITTGVLGATTGVIAALTRWHDPPPVTVGLAPLPGGGGAFSFGGRF